MCEALDADGGLTMLQGVPSMYAKLLDLIEGEGGGVAVPRLRACFSGGAPLDAELKRRFEQRFGVTLHNGYGLTEAAPTIAHTRLDAPRSDCAVGPLLPGVEARLVDPRARDGRDAPEDEPGELWVRGPNVMLGYYRNPALTAATIDADGWLNTGDLARCDADATLSIVGRTKELIIRSGFNVYPVEVEAVLNAHPSILHSAVVGRAVEGNEEVVAFVELRPGASASTAELALHALCSIGIFLGRVLRLNSWDVVTRPDRVFQYAGVPKATTVALIGCTFVGLIVATLALRVPLAIHDLRRASR